MHFKAPLRKVHFKAPIREMPWVMSSLCCWISATSVWAAYMSKMTVRAWAVSVRIFSMNARLLAILPIIYASNRYYSLIHIYPPPPSLRPPTHSPPTTHTHTPHSYTFLTCNTGAKKMEAAKQAEMVTATRPVLPPCLMPTCTREHTCVYVWVIVYVCECVCMCVCVCVNACLHVCVGINRRRRCWKHTPSHFLARASVKQQKLMQIWQINYPGMCQDSRIFHQLVNTHERELVNMDVYMGHMSYVIYLFG